MKKLNGLKLFLFIFSLSLIYGENKEREKLSETLGHYIQEEIDKSNLEIDLEKVIEGLKQAQAGKSAPLNKEEFQTCLDHQIHDLAKKNLQIANNFFKENKKSLSLLELVEEKIQYKVLTPGTDENIKSFYAPLIKIKGYLLDNTVFEPEKELVISIKDLPKGLKQVILDMKEKEKRTVYIHPDYAQNDHVPVNSILIYDIEIIKSDKAKIVPLENFLANDEKKIR